MEQLPQWKDYFDTIGIWSNQNTEGVLLGLELDDLELYLANNHDLGGGNIWSYNFTVRMLLWRRVDEQSVEIEVEVSPNSRATLFGLKPGTYKLSFDRSKQTFRPTPEMFEEGEISGEVADEYTPWPED